MSRSQAFWPSRVASVWRVLGLLTLLLTVLLPCRVASATSGSVILTAGSMYRGVWRLLPGNQYFFETAALTGGGDSVLHVQDYPVGNFLSGNDDFCESTELGTVCYLESSVVIPASSTERLVTVIVRAKAGSPATTGLLKVTRKPVTGPSTTTAIDITLGAGVNDSVNVGSLQAGSHVTTAQLFGGMDDSLLLLVQGNAASAIAFDDNDGIEYMSFLRSACGASCTIVVGHPQPKKIFGVPLPPTPDGPVRVVWDEDAEGPDSDEDHLGNRLEQAIGTNPNRQDSDNDGVADGLELLGGAFIPGAVPAGTSTDGGGDLNNRLKFPLYGANPLVPDVFVEADWLPACRDSDPPLFPCTDAKKDGFRVQREEIGRMAAWVAPELVPHYDTGIANSEPATGVLANDWGGANRLDEAATLFVGPAGNYTRIDVKDFDDGTADTSPDCKGFTSARVGLFHHFIVFDARGGARTAYACGTATGDTATLLHELGHNLNLSHGGPPAKPDGGINAKANHGSVMNYILEDGAVWSRGFSRGRFSGLPINGYRMNEGAGLGTTDPAVLNAFLAGGANRGLVDFATGAIDWNMDGRIDPAPEIRAPAAWHSGGGSDSPLHRANWSLSQGLGPSFPVLTPAAARAARPTIFAHGDTLNGRKVVIATGDPSKCDGGDSYAGSCTEWRTVTENTGSMTIGPGTVVGAGAGSGLTTFFLDDSHQVQGVFPRNPGPGSIAPPSWVVTRLAAGQVEGDIAAVQLPSGVVQVYGIQGGRLRHWEYTPGVNRLSATLPEVWEDQSPVETRFGIGLAYGFQSDMSGVQLYAAIPNAHAVPNTKAVPIEFARLDTQMVEISFLWFRGFVPRAVWTRVGHLQGHPTVVKPSLAYQPFGDTLSEGRFYLSYSYSGAPDGSVTATSWPVLAFTEGNANPPSAASSRRLKWQDDFETRFGGDRLNTEFRGSDGRGGGVAIAVFGRSLVATAQRPGLLLNYFPAADGVFNTPLRDYNEVPFVLGNLRCSLTTNGEGPCAGQ